MAGRGSADDSVREAAQATIEAKSIGSDIDVSLTFGKWEGWSSAELAQAGYVGRNYLSWGSTKLRSPVWRQRFKAALRQYNPEDMDVALAARAIQEGDGISWEDARRLAVAEKQRVVRSQKADRQCREAKEWLNKQLRELGISDQALGPISDYIQQGGMDEINRRVESGQVRFENVNRMLFEAVVGVFESKMDEIVRS